MALKLNDVLESLRMIRLPLIEILSSPVKESIESIVLSLGKFPSSYPNPHALISGDIVGSKAPSVALWISIER